MRAMLLSLLLVAGCAGEPGTTSDPIDSASGDAGAEAGTGAWRYDCAVTDGSATPIASATITYASSTSDGQMTVTFDSGDTVTATLQPLPAIGQATDIYRITQVFSADPAHGTCSLYRDSGSATATLAGTCTRTRQ